MGKKRCHFFLRCMLTVDMSCLYIILFGNPFIYIIQQYINTGLKVNLRSQLYKPRPVYNELWCIEWVKTTLNDINMRDRVIPIYFVMKFLLKYPTVNMNIQI